MKPTQVIRADASRAIQRNFSLRTRRQILAACEPKNYKRRVDAPQCIVALMWSFFRLLPGIRAFVQEYGEQVGTQHISTLSYALRSKWLGRVSEAMLDSLAPPAWRREELVAVDSMSNAISNKRHPGCAKINRLVSGVAVLWAFRVATRAGEAAVEILRFADGGWHDTKLMSDVKLARDGPIYLMDRGFYCLELIQQWLNNRVGFVVRVREKDLKYETLKEFAAPSRPVHTRVGKSLHKRGVLVRFDGLVRLGVADRRGARPVVRLLVGEQDNGEDLILASSQTQWSATHLLTSYGQRWEIEKWHRIVKRVIGLAHVYSYQGGGLRVLVRVATLLAMLLLLEAEPGDQALPTCEILRAILSAARRKRGMYHPWAPNTCGKSWPKKRRKKAR